MLKMEKMQTMNFGFGKTPSDPDKCLASIPGEMIEIDTDLLSKIFQECEEISSLYKNISVGGSHILRTPDLRKSNNSFSPDCFRVPLIRDSPHRLVPKPQKHSNLNTLLFTPKPDVNSHIVNNQIGTPCFWKNLPRPSIDSMLLTTPMLIQTLDNLQTEAENSDLCVPYPDLLQLIDIEFSQFEENTTENTIKSHVEREQILSEITPAQPSSSPRKFCKRRYKTKLMTEEERISIERQSKEKAKRKRKNRFSQSVSCGTRKSKREKKSVVRYTASLG